MFPPGIFLPMSPGTGDAANQMTHSLKIEAALHFSVDYLANEGRLALFPGSGATPQQLPLPFRKADSESGFHILLSSRCKTVCKTESNV
jgi:hypothetical protein